FVKASRELAECFDHADAPAGIDSTYIKESNVRQHLGTIDSTIGLNKLVKSYPKSWYMTLEYSGEEQRVCGTNRAFDLLGKAGAEIPVVNVTPGTRKRGVNLRYLASAADFVGTVGAEVRGNEDVLDPIYVLPGNAESLADSPKFVVIMPLRI